MRCAAVPTRGGGGAEGEREGERAGEGVQEGGGRGQAEAAARREIIPVYENPAHKADNRSQCGFIWQQQQQKKQKQQQQQEEKTLQKRLIKLSCPNMSGNYLECQAETCFSFRWKLTREGEEREGETTWAGKQKKSYKCEEV